MRVPCALAAVLTIAALSTPARAQAGGDASAKVAAATADAIRIGRRDPAGEAAARMKIAEQLMLTDPKAAAAMVEAARAASVRAEGAAGPMVALADYRLALIRALGGDRANQLQPMADAARRVAAGARTPEHRTLAGQALIVGASFAMSSGQPRLADALRDEGIAILDRDDLARTTDLAEAYRVVADVLVYYNRAAEALPWATRSVALYRELDPENPALVFALTRRGSALLRLSRYPEALSDLRAAVIQSDRASDDPTIPIMALRALGNYYWRLGEPDLALPLLKRAMAAAEKLPPGFPYAGGLSRDIMTALLDADRPEEARQFAETTAKLTRATMGATSYEYASALLILARIDVAEDAFDDAARRIDEADAIFAHALPSGNSRGFEPLAVRGALYRATGREADAVALYDRAAAAIAHTPPDDIDRIDVAQGVAAARLAAAPGSVEGWTAARTAADGLTTRIVRQVSGIGGPDTARGRSDRVFGTALDVAWAQARVQAGARPR